MRWKTSERTYRVALTAMTIALVVVGLFATTAWYKANTIDTVTETVATTQTTVTTSNARVMAIQNCVYAFLHDNSTQGTKPNIYFYFDNSTASIQNLGPDQGNPGYTQYQVTCENGFGP